MNSLEAVVLITTSKEIKNGMFFKFCSQFRRMRKNNLDFVIFVNNEDYDEESVSSHLVTNVKIFDSIPDILAILLIIIVLFQIY